MGITILVVFILAIAGAVVWFFIKNKKEPSIQSEKPSEPVSEPSTPPVDEVPTNEEKEPEKPKEEVIKPKFKVGDWVVHNACRTFMLITDIGETNYELTSSNNGYDYTFPFSGCEITFHKFTIEDAKDGDVLVDGNLPFIFKKIDTNKYSYAYCGISIDGGFKIKSEGESGEWTWMQDIKPATKEQRDKLEKAITEAGYEWSDKDRKLIKIVK